VIDDDAIVAGTGFPGERRAGLEPVLEVSAG